MVGVDRVVTDGLLERESELAQIDDALQQASHGSGCLVVVEAAAGLGKSTLLAMALEHARELGLRPLGARGTALEREFAFGIVRQLLAPHVSRAGANEQERLFAGAGALARPLIEGLPDTAALTPDPTYATLHGLYWLLANLSATGPLALAIDDAHWADTASLRLLGFLLPRLGELPLALLVSVRSGDAGVERAPLAGLVASPEALALRPRPLSRAAACELVGAAFDGAPDPGFAAACHEVTAGNPFFLHALLAELVVQGVGPSAQQAQRLRGLGPRAVSRSVLLRVSDLGADAPALARAAAVLGDGASIEEAAALAHIAPERSCAIADRLCDIAILRRSQRLEFVHPIVREAVYADLGPQERAAHRARAARVLAAAGAQPERIAAQLLGTAPAGDPWVVDMLREAGRQAVAKGAPEVALAHLRRALDEPPDAASRPRLLLELGTAGAACGAADALACLAEAGELALEPDVQAGAGFELARALLYSGRATEAVDVLENVLDRLGESDPALLPPLEALLLMQVQTTIAARRRLLHRLLVTMREVESDAPVAPGVLATVAIEIAECRGPVSEAAPLAVRALGEGRLLRELSPESPAVYFATCALTLADRGDLAETHLAQAIAAAREGGAVRGFAFASCFRGWTRYRRGDLPGAESDLDAFLALALEFSLDIVLPFGLGALVGVRLERGAGDRAVETLAAVDRAEWDQDSVLYQELRAARARLALAQRRPRDALAETLAISRWEAAWGARHDAWTHWRPLAALAHAALGQDAEARRIALEAVDLAREFGAAGHLGVSLRAAGVVADREAGIRLLEEAVSVLERSQARLEHAHALTDLGAALRRANRRADARVRLGEGLELARACGATAAVERAAGELQATGARARSVPLRGVDALTPSERRIAEMAAEGLSNPQIAQALFVSLKTVETHLGHAYQKLGIGSRAKLPEILGGQ